MKRNSILFLIIFFICNNSLLYGQPLGGTSLSTPSTINPATLHAWPLTGGSSSYTLPIAITSTTMPVTTAQWHFSGQNSDLTNTAPGWYQESEDWVYSLVSTPKKEIIACGYCTIGGAYKPIIFKLDHTGNLVWSRPIPNATGVANVYDFSSSSTPSPYSESTSGAFFAQITKANDGYIAIGRGSSGMFIVEIDDNGTFLNGTPIDVKPPTTSTNGVTVSSSTSDGACVAVSPYTPNINATAHEIIVGGRVNGLSYKGAGILELDYTGSTWQLNKSYYGGGVSTTTGSGSEVVKILTQSTGSGAYNIYACGGVSSTYDNLTTPSAMNADPESPSTGTFTVFDKDIWILKMNNSISSLSIKEDRYNKNNIYIGGYNLNTINSTTFPYSDVGPLSARNMDASSPHDIKYYDQYGVLHLSDMTQYLNAINNKNELAYDMIFAADGKLAVITHVNVIGTNFKNGMGYTSAGVVFNYCPGVPAIPHTFGCNASSGAAPQYDEYVDGDAFLLEIDPSLIGVYSAGNPTSYGGRAKNVGHFSGKDFYMQIKQDREGHYIITGSTADKYGTTDYNLPDAYWANDNALIVCTDNSFPGTGDIWRRSFIAGDSRATDFGPTATHNNVDTMNCTFALDTTADGGYVIGGNNSNNHDDFVITKFAPLHQELMEQSIGGSYELFSGSVIPAIHDITSGESWTTDKTIASWVVVENGAYLDIYGSGTSPVNIKFAASDQLYDYWNAPNNFASGGGLYGCGILVKPGGVLHIYNANVGGVSFTGQHNVWDGIVTQGSPVDPSLYPTAPQALAAINGAIIQDARVGVYAGDDYRAYFKNPTATAGTMTGYNYTSHYDGTYTLGGAKITCDPGTYGGATAPTKFADCRYGAIFENYIWGSNGSYFNQAQFNSDATGMGDVCFYADPTGGLIPANTHVFAVQWNDLSLYDNTFTCDLSFPVTERPIGVQGIATNLTVTQSSLSGNQFTNLSTGIEVDEGCPTLLSQTTITQNTFDNNVTGINASGKSNNLVIQYNNINIPFGSTGIAPVGVNLFSCNEYDLSYNTFDHATGSAYGWIGTMINDGSTEDENVNDNIFNKVSIGNFALQKNGDATALSGLAYRCNAFNNSAIPIGVASIRVGSPTIYPGVIRPNQGTCLGAMTDPAGNEFNLSCSSVFYNLWADPDVVETINYADHDASSALFNWNPGSCISSVFNNQDCHLHAPSFSAACPPGFHYTMPDHITALTTLAELDVTISTTTDASTLADLWAQHDAITGYLARYYVMNGMYDSAAIMYASYNKYRDALPFYISAGDYTDAQTMHDDLPLVTDEDKLYAWESQLAINLYSTGKTWLDIDTVSLDSMKHIVQYNSAAGGMAGGIMALVGVGPVTYPMPALDSATIDSILLYDVTDSSGERTSSTHKRMQGQTSNNFRVYPNPTSGVFTVLASSGGTFTVYSMLGQTVQQNVVTSGTSNFQLPASLVAGIYLGKFKPDDGSGVKEVRIVYSPQ